MRRLAVWNVMTLDGYFEGRSPWDLGFHETVWGDELEAFSLEQGEEIGTLLFGRRTYEGMASHWSKETGATADMMNSIEKAVASRTLDEATWNNTRLLKGEAAEAIRALKAEEGKDIFVFGSADLLGSLFKAGLVDEYRICIAPVVLGGGNPLFKPQDQQVKMRLESTRQLKTSGVVLTYAVGG
ncbi:dihydrofolate reductase family protein [Chelativorans salis]|uniref:Dihydrofolate reductase family protein n=1 Tax=Chelativorans salis TaxID=2978478 RepID=A0ABT2LLQ5_9HYPH|nr:dihydrofolate reductase family protein [Chelativorans sp. EGI FJ00035]MCT7374757.1 dihydrofolate reductase family protein [Chelativorans sp. EGI FJ00035]